MRLWSIHPKYLDTKGLLAVWREGLLAQAVLAGQTKGYKHHPQLSRFQKKRDPLAAIGSYLKVVIDESKTRGYRFDETKILKQMRKPEKSILVTRGQLDYERKHLLAKLKIRDPERFDEIEQLDKLSVHPIFSIVAGKIEPWEKLTT